MCKEIKEIETLTCDHKIGRCLGHCEIKKVLKGDKKINES